MLIDDGLLEKRRGIGMFVAVGARERLLDERRQRFAERYVEPMVAEANRLGIDVDALVDAGPRVRATPRRNQGMTPTISVTGLTRRYRDQLALDDVTLDIEGRPSPDCSAATAPARAR